MSDSPVTVPNNTTVLAGLFDPEVASGLINQKLVDAIKLSPLAIINTELEGTPGSKIVLPAYNYIGDSEAVGEEDDLPIKKLTQTTDEVEIIEEGVAVEITDRAQLMGYGDAMGEAVNQIVTAVASGVEKALIADATTNAQLVYAKQSGVNEADTIADALTLFGEDIDGEKVLLIDPSFYAKLRKTDDWIPNTEIGADMIVRGTVGMIHGCQVVPMNRLKNKNLAFIVKRGALAIFSKRNVLVEYDRDILGRKSVIAGSKMYAPYVYDKSKLIKITLQ